MPDSGVVPVPSRADMLNATGAQMFGKNEIEAARLHFLAALYLEPCHGQALQNLGACLRTMRHYEAAASVARRSVALSGDNPFCRSNLAVSYFGLHRYIESRDILKGVCDDLPKAPLSWHNYGLVQYMLGDYNDALASFSKALELAPGNVQLQSDRSLALLSLGRIAEGLASYESRWGLLHKNKIWNKSVPEWRGEDLNGRNLLLHHEQGFGDTIMLVRYVDDLLGRGCSITLAVPQELVRLCAHNYPTVRVVALSDLMFDGEINFDYHSPLLSAMRHLGMEKVEDIGSWTYMRSTGKILPVDLLPGSLRIAVCWASGNHGPAMNERRRQVPLTMFLPLTELPGVTLVSVQKGDASKDISNNGMEGLIFDMSNYLEDFQDTADFLAMCDVVISVDSAVAHLAGAMGKRCLMLSPYSRCWRWWDHVTGKPWYDEMTQHHQSQDGTWRVAMNEVCLEVANYVR